jgi:glycosyltransferase involved in cell wall biosynthesis
LNVVRGREDDGIFAGMMKAASSQVAPIYLSVVVPAYNELDNLEPLVERVGKVLDGLDGESELIMVDDGSTDGTGDRLDQLATGEPRLKVLHLAENRGQSAALDAGFQHSRGGYVALLDADLQTFPEDLPGMLELLIAEQLDAVVGIRSERHDSNWKRLSSGFANWVRNRLTREEIIDTGCPIKVFRGDAIRAITMFKGMHRFLPTLLRMKGFSVRQIPVRHTSRQAGRSKYGTWDRALPALRDALAVRWMQDRNLDWRLR